MKEMFFLSLYKRGKDLNVSSASTEHHQLPPCRWITTMEDVYSCPATVLISSKGWDTEALTYRTNFLSTNFPPVLAFALSYHPIITPGGYSDSTVSKDIFHSTYNPESGIQLLFKIATLPLKSVATELMTRLLGVLPQLCLRLLISKQIINSLATSGFSGIIAPDMFNSPLFLESFPRQL